MSLKGVKYDFKKEAIYNDSLIKDAKVRSKLEAGRKNQLGFLAQDVQEILPEVVDYCDSTDSYGIKYTSLIPVIVEAMKEQQNIIEGLQAEILALKSGGNLKSGTNTGSATDEQNNATRQTNELFQNMPNPFSQNTTIEYSLTANVQYAQSILAKYNH
jgi:hypothetical protein